MPRKQEQRHVTYDHDLGIEAYQLSGVVQKFPNHFHDFYVIGFIEGGQRHLWCKGREYDLRPGELILFNPRDNHYCSPMVGELLDYRAVNNISLETLLSMTSFGKTCLLRSFTKQLGVSPYRYLQTIRIDRAKKLLEQGVEPIEAAVRTGFSDQSHFTNFFKAFIGLTPKQYQRIFTDGASPDAPGGEVAAHEV